MGNPWFLPTNGKLKCKYLGTDSMDMKGSSVKNNNKKNNLELHCSFHSMFYVSSNLKRNKRNNYGAFYWEEVSS